MLRWCTTDARKREREVHLDASGMPFVNADQNAVRMNVFRDKSLGAANTLLKCCRSRSKWRKPSDNKDRGKQQNSMRSQPQHARIHRRAGLSSIRRWGVNGKRLCQRCGTNDSHSEEGRPWGNFRVIATLRGVVLKGP
jgi:hypothetical protein